MLCRCCNNKLKTFLIDLGKSPVANTLAKKSNEKTKNFDLQVYICDKCWLLQTNDLVAQKQIFKNDYPYFSGYSKTWLNHLNKFVKKIKKNFPDKLKKNVCEIASNDGSLLEILKSHNIDAFGIEPTRSTYLYSKKKGFKVINSFFTNNFAKKIKFKSDFIIANNVLAHVPNLNDFIKGIKKFLSHKGIATFEIQYLPSLIKFNQFDTIYHEHFSYFSIVAAKNIFNRNNLKIFDCEKINTHGGSIRLYVAQENNFDLKETKRLSNYYSEEKKLGIDKIKFYKNFSKKIKLIKKKTNILIERIRKKKKIISAYGAAAKANTFFNYVGIKNDKIKCIIDKNPQKVGKFLPGSNIPIKSKDYLNKIKPDYIFIMTWNIKDEVVKELNFTKKWGCKFVTFIPKIKKFN